MSQRNRPGRTARLGSELAAAVLNGSPSAVALAKQLLDRDAEIAKRRQEERNGAASLRAFRRSEERR